MTNDDPPQRLLGTWKLIAAVREEIPSGAKTDFLGSHPTGYINYAPDGRMMVLNVGNGRSKPAGANATRGGGSLVPQHDQLWRHLHHRPQRDHSPCRRLVE